MYWFDYRSGYPRYRRRRRGFYGFPWWLFFAFFWVIPRQFWGFIFIGFLVLALLTFISYMNSRSQGMNQSQPYYNPGAQNPPQQPYYQPTPQPHEQVEADQPYYQPYQQGYQYQASANERANYTEEAYGQAPEQIQEDPYQPKAEYPQQMPPM
ncbi:hypothetical protein [Dictyobacter formicarum]|uniref:Uncharacterized protein n=1 Tax=Dictyobacter formicarum TaxID=2778368 RepID=A0ABQ3VTM8_9CHLR|nr:hypothetical protein [Dictyobacter formicarum]GHO88913.1 hypothetical protein KSZ_69190 [Dictyobacter formicarum]